MSTDTAGLVLAIGIIIASWAALGWFAWAASRWEADRHWDGKR
jgi:hypothetical protein